MDKIAKYKEKARIILVLYSNKDDKTKIRQSYDENKKGFHQRWVKIIFDKKKSGSTEIFLIGFHGSIKYNYKKWNVDKIFKHIDKMENKEYVGSLNKLNFSLYEEYKPKSRVQGLGYKNKVKAEETLKKIKNMPLSYQKRTVITMKARAENHPHQTKDMKEAIKVFDEWLIKH